MKTLCWCAAALTVSMVLTWSLGRCLDGGPDLLPPKPGTPAFGPGKDIGYWTEGQPSDDDGIDRVGAWKDATAGVDQ